jgi:DNA-binding winged helix-turn-helix (wHTH) protein
MNKSFIVERDVLIQIWAKQKITVDAADLTSAVNRVRRMPKEDIYDEFPVVEDIIWDTREDVNSQINIDKCYEIPHQPKLNL